MVQSFEKKKILIANCGIGMDVKKNQLLNEEICVMVII